MNLASSPSKPAAASPYVFEATGLIKDFDDGQVHALRGVDLRIADAEFVAIVGPSGSGKTTLLQVLGALDRPSEGTLKYRGESLLDLPDPAAYRAHQIGFVFQAFHLLPTFTAIENVQIPMFEDHKSRAERQDRALELLRAVGLEERMNHYPAKLSGENASALPSPAAWPILLRCFWPTSQPAIWIVKALITSSTCSGRFTPTVE